MKKENPPKPLRELSNNRLLKVKNESYSKLG